MSSIESGQSNISENLLCIGCGYNLRGLNEAMNCPECGKPVSQSPQSNLLHYCDPGWLEKIRLGVSVKLWSFLIFFVQSLVLGSLIPVFSLPSSIGRVFSIAFGAINLWSTFLITTQEPSISLGETSVTLRKTVRICAIIGFFGAYVGSGVQGGVFSSISYLIAGATGLAEIAAACGELIYFRRFATRIPDEKLAKSTKYLLWTATICVACSSVIGMVLAIISGGQAQPSGIATQPAAPPTPGATLMAAGCYAPFVLFVLFPWYVFLLLKYCKAFKAAAEQARTLTRDDTPGLSDV